MVHKDDDDSRGGEAPSLRYRLASTTVHVLTKALRLIDGSARRRYGWDPYMLGSYAPVSSEVLAEELEVLEGALPPGLEGAFIRTGSNPKRRVEGGYFWFDGDGMTHVVRIKGGRASYCNRWVQTARLAQEDKAGWAIFTSLADYRGLAALGYFALRKLSCALGLVSDKDGNGTANTAIAYHAGRVLALHEGDLPYGLRIACSGLVETVGRATYDGKIGHAFTAHPKLDPATRECFYFGYEVERAPYCWYGWLDAKGQVVRDFAVPLPQPIMMHDFAITEHYALILDVPLVFDPQVMIKHKQLPFVFEDRPARGGVLPRYAQSGAEIRWFTLDRFMCFHTANAWEEGGKIRLFLCTFNSFSLDTLRLEPDSEPFISEVAIDLEAGTAERRRLPGALPGDFPVVPPSLVGRRTRYAYVATMEPAAKTHTPQFIGVTKYDLSVTNSTSAVAGQVLHGGRLLGGEAFFVPREGEGGEDAGWLLTIATDEGSLESQLLVYDAATMSSTPVCRLRLPQRVPHGFHCSWVTEAQLQAQAP